MKWKTNTAKLNRHCAYRLREPKDSIRTIYTLCIVFTIVSVIWAVNADCQVDPTTGAEIQRLEGLLQRDPGNREVHHNLAKNLSWSKRYEESIAEYRRLLAAKEEPAIRSELIDVLMWAGKHDEALAEVDSILAKDPANIKAALQRARALNWSGRLEEALKAYGQVLALDPGNREAQFERGQVASWLGRSITAESLLRDFLASNPNYAGAHNQLADTYKWAGYWAGALREYTAATRLDPHLDAAQRGLAETRAATSPALLLDGLFFNNSDGFQRWLQRGGMRFYLRPDLALEGHYLHWTYKQRTERIHQNSSGLSMTWQPNLTWLVKGGLFGSHYSTGGNTVTGYAQTRLLPWDRTTLSLGYSRLDIFAGAPAEVVGVFDESSLAAVRRKIQADDFHLSVTQQLASRLTLFGATHLGFYHDPGRGADPGTGANGRASATAELSVLALKEPQLNLGYQFFYLHVSRHSSSFFSPDAFQTHGGFIRVTLPLPASFTFSVDETLFWQKSTRPSGDSLGNAVTASLLYALGQRVRAHASFHFIDSAVGARESFFSRQAFLGLQINF